METQVLDQATELVEKANANLEPELLTAEGARSLLASYARLERLASFGIASLTRKLKDPGEIAKATGSSVGKAKALVATGETLAKSDELAAALQHGDISLDQATHIAAAEEAAPGAAAELVAVARSEPFHVMKDKAQRVRLEAEQHRDLATRQRGARFGRSHSDPLGMVHIHLALEPHVGVPVVARAEAEAERLAKGARRKAADEGGRTPSEPFERHLADAYAAMLKGSGKGRAKRPELVVLVSYEVAKRGWTDVREGEVCKIPGIGPVSPQVVKEIAADAFLNGVFFDGKDLRHFNRWSRDIPVEVAVALELGEAPDFDGISCVDCGHRFRTEFDHVHPRRGGGPTAHPNLKPRCWSCHQAKTKRDRLSGKLRR